MNAEHKKSVLRMIPYGIYVLTADDGNNADSFCATAGRRRR
jgi:hypothetical protein